MNDSLPLLSNAEVRTVKWKEHELVHSLRQTLLGMLDSPDLAANLSAIARFADHACDLLSVVKDPAAALLKEGDAMTLTAPGMPMPAPASSAETFGAKMLREILAATKPNTETPIALVEAITLARRAGLTDVSAELERKLCGKALDGARPVADVQDQLRAHYLGELGEVRMKPPPEDPGEKPCLERPAHTWTTDGSCIRCGQRAVTPRKDWVPL